MDFYSLQAKKLEDEEEVSMAKYKGKVVLIENTATSWDTTIRDFVQMNRLCSKFSDSLAVLCFPCNQFGGQESFEGEEILDQLRYVMHLMPKDKSVPQPEMFAKTEVNGANENPVYTYLKKKLPAPIDDQERILYK